MFNRKLKDKVNTIEEEVCRLMSKVSTLEEQQGICIPIPSRYGYSEKISFQKFAEELLEFLNLTIKTTPKIISVSKKGGPECP
jgi:hypothetical protein